MRKPLSTHDERQSAYRGPGPDAEVDGRGRDDPSAPLPEQRSDDGMYPRGHGKGGRLGEGEPGDQPQRDGSTQPDLGQHGGYGKASTAAAPTAGKDPGADGSGASGDDAPGADDA